MRPEIEVQAELRALEELKQHRGFKLLYAEWLGRMAALRRQAVETPVKALDDAFVLCANQGNLAGFQWAMGTLENLESVLLEELAALREQRRMEEDDAARDTDANTDT